MEEKKYKVCYMYCSYVSKVEADGLTFQEAVDLKKILESKSKKGFVYYDIFLDV